jgi:23S rRNA (adenine2503-C2)-methyltransferase
MELEKIEKVLVNEPSYRLSQVERALYRDLIDSWNSATNLPASLRQKLEKEVPLNFNCHSLTSLKGNSIKAIIELKDGLKIESVLMQHRDGRNTVCVSSQVGCPMGCVFCSTGKIGFIRNLNYYEIIEQVLFFSYYLKKIGKTVTNVVFMGMGEPFLNYDNVIKAIRILNDRDKFNIGARRLSVSTAGIPAGIKKLSGEKLQVNLAVSLNAPNDIIRREIMPIDIKYPIKEVISAVKFYIKKTGRRVMFEYVMLRGLNDSDILAEELAKLVRGMLCFVNLIPYNGSENNLRPSTRDRIKKFKEVIKKGRITVTERFRFGDDINAACGQLVYRKTNEKI